MSYLLQYAGMSGDQYYDTSRRTYYPVMTVIDIMLTDGGSAFKDYLPGDVGKTVTLISGTHQRQAKAVITGVAGGMITSVSMTDGGLYYVMPQSQYNCSGGSGSYATLGFVYETMPAIFAKGLAGMPTSYSQVTLSMWAYLDCGSWGIRCLTPDYVGDSTGFGLSPGYIQSLSLRFDNPWFRADFYAGLASSSQLYSAMFNAMSFQGGPNSSPFIHILYSFDRASQKSLCYINDMPAPIQSQGYSAGTAITNTTNSVWGIAGILQSSYNVNSANFAAIWLRNTFIDLTVEANRRQFINADLTAVDPSTLPIAPLNFYLAPGDSPGAIATNRGTGGAWQTLGTIDWSDGRCWPMVVVASADRYSTQHSFFTPYNTPVSGTLSGHGTPSYPPSSDNVPDYTIRPGCYLVFTVETPPQKGDLILNLDGSFTFTPHHSASGDDTFTYRATEQMDSPSQTFTSAVGTGSIYIGYPNSPQWDFVVGS